MTHNPVPLMDRICCPVCGSLFGNARQVDEDHGMVTCSNCNGAFPVRDGVFYAIMPSLKPGHEIRLLLDRHLFWWNLQQDTLEAEFHHILNLVRKESAPLYQAAYSGLCKKINFHSNPLILVSGVGAREMGQSMALQGARVVAMDYYPAELLDTSPIYIHTNHNEKKDIPLRLAVGFPWALPFLNEQFDAVIHTFSTPCAVPHQKLVDELVRVASHNANVFLFWGHHGRIPIPHGNELHGGLFEPRTYLPPNNPGALALKLALLWAGGSVVTVTGYTVDEKKLPPATQDPEQGEFRDIPAVCNRAFTVHARKRKRHQVRGPQRGQKLVKHPPGCERFAFTMTEWRTNDLTRDLLRMLRENADKNALTTFIDCGKNLGFWNELGWRHMENIGTEMARYPFSNAVCHLKGHDEAKVLKLYAFGVPRRVIRQFSLAIEINGVRVEPDNPIKPGWQTLNFDLAAVPDKDVLQVYLHQENLFRLIDNFSIFDYRSLGIGVKNISVE